MKTKLLAEMSVVAGAVLCALPAEKPNVLFVVIDDLNDYVSLLQDYPGIQTPNLDRFARSAMTFTHAYCAAPICNPSRTAFLSGIAPYRSGVYGNDDQLRKSKPVMASRLLPEQFRDNGYYTLWCGKLFHTEAPEPRMNAMWNDAEGGKGKYAPKAKVDPIPDSIPHSKFFFNYEAWTGPDTDFSDVVDMRITRKRLGKTYDQPFFMVYGIYRPHNPWTAPRRFFDLYPLDSIQLPDVPEGDLDDIPPVGREYALSRPIDFHAIKEAGLWKPVLQSYLACISFMDDCLGQVLDALDRSPHRDNTIVCIVADHGFHMGEKEHFAKYALWEQTTRLLMMWRVPGMTAPGSRCDAPVNLLDLYPTFNELCSHGPVPQQLDGSSLVSLLKNPKSPWDRPSVTTFNRNDYAVRDSRWRYIRYHDGSEELYDHTRDPKEWNNLAGSPEYETVKKELARWFPAESAPPVPGKRK
ncbi:MAG: sulfatase [Kiritimatiellales bacterium]